MLVYIFIAFSVAVSSVAAAEEDNACYDVTELYQKTKSLHDKCKEESKEKSHDDKDACYLAYRFCHLTAMSVLNEAKNGVNHEKMVALLTKSAKENKKSVIAADVAPCGKLELNEKDKIQPYFDCIEKQLSKDCPEISSHRTEFRGEFEGSATDICK